MATKKRSHSPYKQPRETPFTQLGKVSGKSTRVSHKVMKGKLPGKVESILPTEELCAAILEEIKVKEAKQAKVYYDASGRPVCATPSFKKRR